MRHYIIIIDIQCGSLVEFTNSHSKGVLFVCCHRDCYVTLLCDGST